MKLLVFYIGGIFFPITSCIPGISDADSTSAVNNNDTHKIESKMKIRIDKRVFAATLYDNATASAFKSLLPTTVKMLELNGNEKYADLSHNIPTMPYRPGTIRTGDLMIYGSSTLVLFYKTFSSSYSYTKLGRINDVKGLAEALGPGDVTVVFELE